MNNAIVWLDYVVNFEYIKEVLCINKEEPELQCNGKCHLMKRLQQEESQDERNLPMLKITKTEYAEVNLNQEEQVLELIPISYTPSYYLFSKYTKPPMYCTLSKRVSKPNAGSNRIK